MILLAIMAIVLTIELAYILHRKRQRKEEMSAFRRASEKPEPLKDRAHNAILTTENISASLARQGVDTSAANSLLDDAKAEMAARDYSSAIERADAAKLVLLRAKRELDSKPREDPALQADPGKRPMDRSIYESGAEAQAQRTDGADSLPANYLQSKFMLSSVKDLLEKKGIASGDAYVFYTDASKAFDMGDFTRALSLAIKAERLLDSGSLALIGGEKPVQSNREIVEVLVCPKCEGELSEDDAFCGECGHSLEASAACPGCGQEIAGTDKFCRKCGQRLM